MKIHWQLTLFCNWLQLYTSYRGITNLPKSYGTVLGQKNDRGSLSKWKNIFETLFGRLLFRSGAMLSRAILQPEGLVQRLRNRRERVVWSLAALGGLIGIPIIFHLIGIPIKSPRAARLRRTLSRRFCNRCTNASGCNIARPNVAADRYNSLPNKVSKIFFYFDRDPLSFFWPKTVP